MDWQGWLACTRQAADSCCACTAGWRAVAFWLPWAPLPGQADRAERARPALREPDLRTALERSAHRVGGHSLGRDAHSRGTASYYDRAGALRDMLQNHLLQLLCLVALEPPHTLTPRDLRDRKVDVLRAVRA